MKNRAPLVILSTFLLASGCFAFPVLQESRSLGRLVQLLHSPELAVRMDAALALARLGPAAKAAVPDLAGCLEDRDAAIRAVAAEALGKIGPVASDAKQSLVRLLNDTVPGVRAAAATALGSIAPGDPVVAESLRSAAADGNAEVRNNASRALQEVAKSGSGLQSTGLQSASSLSELARWTRQLNSPDRATRLDACVRIGNLGPAASTSVSALSRMLKDPESIVRAGAADALGRIGPAAESASASLRQAMRDPDQLVRTEASSALSKITGSPQPATTADASPAQTPPTTQTAPVQPAAGVSLARFERLPPPKPGPRTKVGEPAPPPQPTYAGKSLGEWIQLLRSRDAAVRLQAADALGKIGPPAEPAIGPLNFARIDADARVRERSAWALCRILGIQAGGRAANTPKPKPKASSAGTGGRVFFFRTFHEAGESGVRPRAEIRRFRENNTIYPGSWDLYLNYLDLAEVQRYREDAKKRNVPGTDRPYLEILRADPQAKEARERFQFVKTYKHDYVIRITCARQTAYWYKRFSETNPSPMIDGSRNHGGSHFLGMTPGNYSAHLTVFAAEGFRLEFEVEFRLDSPPDPAPERVAALASIAGPQDIARQERLRVDTPQPKLKGDNGIRARRALDVAKAVQQAAWDLALYHRAARAELAPYLADAATMYRRAFQLDPAAPAHADDVLGFMGLCSRVGGPEAFVQARKVALIVEASAMAAPGTGEREVGIAAYNASSAYNSLAHMAIAHRNDVALCRDYRQHALRYLGPAIHPHGAALDKVEIASEDHWPQPDWYPDSLDELQPPKPAEEDDEELLAMASGQPAKQAGQPAQEASGGEADWGSLEVTDDSLRLLEEKLQEIDNERAGQERFLDRMGERRLRAKEQTILSLEKLEMIRIALAKLQGELNYFQSVLSWTPDRKGADPAENAIYSLMRTDSTIRRDLAGNPEAMRRTIQGVLDKLQNKQIALEQERDRTIQDVLLEYKAIAGDLRANSLNSIWPRVRAGAEAAIRSTEEAMTLVEVQLNLSAGKEKEFREKARACIAAEKWEYEVRLLEAKYFMSKGQRGLALNAARNALAVGKEGYGEYEDLELETQSDGTLRRMAPTPAQQVIRGLEMDALNLIDSKISSEAKAFEKLCREKILTHGDKGFFSFVGDALTGGITGSYSAIGNRPAILDTFGMANPDQEDIYGGKQEQQAREIGFVLDDATRAHLGMNMILRFREQGISLESIRNFTDETFRETVTTEFGWKSMTKEHATKMRAAMMLAFDNRDVKRLLEWKGQPFDFETGKDYLDCEAYRAPFVDKILDGNVEVADVAEVLEDAASAKNILLFLGPSAQVSAAWRGTTFLEWANPVIKGANAAEVVTLKEAFAAAVRLPQLAEWLSRSEIGNAMLADFAALNNRMRLLGKIGVDASVQMNAATLAGLAAETVTSYLGGGEKAQRWAKEIAELLTQVITAYGVGDYDVAAKLAQKTAVRPEQIRAVANALQTQLDTGDEVAAVAAPFAKQLDDVAQELNTSGAISQNTRRALDESARELEEQMAKLAARLANEESEVALAEFMRLKGIRQALAAAPDGMPGQLKTWKSFVDDLTEKIKDGRAAVQSQKTTCESLARGLEDPAARAMNQTGKIPTADFRKPSILRMADRLALAEDLKGARRAYSEAIAVLEQLGVENRRDLKELYERLLEVEKRLNVQEHFKALGLKQAAGQQTLPDLTEELEAIRKSGYTLMQIGQGISSPYWVLVNGRKVGVFKPKQFSGALARQFPFMTEAEEVVPKLAKELDIASPAGIRTTLKVFGQGAEVEGAFVRYVEGQSLFDCTALERIVLKKQIAKDMVLRALVGDRDGHALNYKLGPDGIVRPIDRNFTDFLDQEEFLKKFLAGFPNDTPDQAIRRAMSWRLQFSTTYKQQECYGAMSELMEHMVYEDFADTIRIVKTWNREKLALLIGDTFGDKTEAVLTMMEKRLAVIDKVFEQFKTIPELIPPSPGEIASAEEFHEDFSLPLAA